MVLRLIGHFRRSSQAIMILKLLIPNKTNSDVHQQIYNKAQHKININKWSQVWSPFMTSGLVKDLAYSYSLKDCTRCIHQ